MDDTTRLLEALQDAADWVTTGLWFVVLVAAVVLWMRTRAASAPFAIGVGIHWLIGLVWGVLDLLDLPLYEMSWLVLCLSLVAIVGQLIMLVGVALLPVREAASP